MTKYLIAVLLSLWTLQSLFAQTSYEYEKDIHVIQTIKGLTTLSILRHTKDLAIDSVANNCYLEMIDAFPFHLRGVPYDAVTLYKNLAFIEINSKVDIRVVVYRPSIFNVLIGSHHPSEYYNENLAIEFHN